MTLGPSAAMAGHHQLLEQCIRQERGCLAFWSPAAAPHRPGTRAQVIEVFSLQVATGYTRDPQGRLLLEASPSVAAGRSWSMAKAAQLIRNDARPQRWVALQLDKQAWGLFWAGGGLQRCRELLTEQIGAAEASSALVPATPEALLRLVLDLNLSEGSAPASDAPTLPNHPRSAAAARPRGPAPSAAPPLHELIHARLDARKRRQLIWRIAAGTSLVWLAVLGATVAGFLSVLERQDRKLELLLERTAPSHQQAPVMPAP